MRAAAVVLALVASLALLAALSDRRQERADFTFVNKNNVTTLDPQLMSWQQDFRVARLVYEGLLRNDVFSPSFAPEPAIAESWEISPDGLVYTFHLRDAKWSNGDRVRAGDFVYAWRRGLLPDNAADYMAQLALVKGGEAFFAWRQKELAAFAADQTIKDRPAAARALWERTLEEFARTVGVRALDDSTLEVTLERPTPFFLDLCAFGTFYPVYPPLLEAHERLSPETGVVETDPRWTRPQRLVSNGPFNLTLWRFQRDMRLEKNPLYWNAPSVAIDSIGIPSIEDGNAAVLAFRAGAIDWISDVVAPYRGEMIGQKEGFYAEHRAELAGLHALNLDPIETDRRLPGDPRKAICALPGFGTYFWNFNCLPNLPDGRANPFHDPRVRRAFCMVVDKASIAGPIRRSGEPPSGTLIPPDSIGGYVSPKGLPCASDPDRDKTIALARELLAQAGYPGGKGMPTVDLLFNKDGGHDLIAQALAKDWQKNLGVSVSLTQKEIKVFRDDLKNQNYMTARGSWFGDYNDPTTFLDINRSGDGNNDRKYNSKEFDGLLDLARDERDPKKRMELLARAEAVLLEDAPLLPIFQYANIYMFDPDKLTGISPHPRGDQDLALIDVFGDGKGTDAPKAMKPGAVIP